MKQVDKCYLCGKRVTKSKNLLKQQNISKAVKEHFVPSLFFPDEYKIAKNIQLTTLPACETCNNSYSNDEKNFYHFFGGLSGEIKSNEFIMNDIGSKLTTPREINEEDTTDNINHEDIKNKIIDKIELQKMLSCCKSDLYYPNNEILLNLDGEFKKNKRIRDMKESVIDKIVKGMFYIGTNGSCLGNVEYKQLDYDTVRMSRNEVDETLIMLKGKPLDGIELLYENSMKYPEIFMGRLIRHTNSYTALIVLWIKWIFIRTFELQSSVDI